MFAGETRKMLIKLSFQEGSDKFYYVAQGWQQNERPHRELEYFTFHKIFYNVDCASTGTY